MNVNDSSFNLVTATLIVMGIVVFFGVLRLFVWLFAGPNPLRWNAEARVEAAQNPGNLIQADREFRHRRDRLWLLILVTVVLVLVQIAPVQSRAVADAIGLLLVEVVRVVRESVTAFLATRGG
jgi:hypothetical protein